ncbi:minor structural protein [Lactococcus phage c2]|uniref:Minor structural protein n=2 Tax=Ceduovirus c2 TaxID=31537 RepID=Q38310_BPLC2|nr:virion structural protein [Lactococcus phage c2]AAA92194.1 minor structural protein [Lactococcus phage c2]AAT81368.1 minor virion protein [Lactococcus phage Rc6]
MISWLNFEELLIHNPIELINPSKDTIRVAMSQKQYIEFFSNKYTYNGLYYDEEMDFCLFYYADPLQSYKEGDVYAQGYIDVEMKIYRVKWLCNVSISRPSGLLQTTDGTQGVPQEGGKYTHTAWSYSADGTDRFSTVYPNLNLLNGTKDFNGDWINGGVWGNDGKYKGLTVKSYQKAWDGMFKKYIVPQDGLYTWSSFVKSESDTSDIFRVLFINNKEFPIVGLGHKFDWLRDSVTVPLKKGDEVIFNYGNLKNNGGKLSVAGYKLESGSIATPWMPSASEVTTSDGPSYIGQYTDYTLEDSTNPSSYTWREIREDKWNVTKIGMLVSPQDKQITMVQAGALMKCGINNDITGWTDGTTQLNYSGQDFIIDGYGMRGLHNG